MGGKQLRRSSGVGRAAKKSQKHHGIKAGLEVDRSKDGRHFLQAMLPVHLRVGSGKMSFWPAGLAAASQPLRARFMAPWLLLALVRAARRQAPYPEGG